LPQKNGVKTDRVAQKIAITPTKKPKKNSMNRLPTALVILLATQIAAQAAPPVSFRMVAKIFGTDPDQPVSENLTLFDSGVAYDLPVGEARFVTVYDPAKERVTLLDRLTQVQTTLSRDDLVRIVAQARATITDPKDQARAGLTAKVQSDPVSGHYQIQFGNFEYVATTQTADQPAAAADYGRFVDLAARLNLVRRLGPPPFGRMTLNDSITRDNRLPLELTRTVTRGAVADVHRKTHQLTETLTDGDRDQINQVQSMMTLYRQVPLSEFPN
jgi:hypothetical protein